MLTHVADVQAFARVRDDVLYIYEVCHSEPIIHEYLELVCREFESLSFKECAHIAKSFPDISSEILKKFRCTSEVADAFSKSEKMKHLAPRVYMVIGRLDVALDFYVKENDINGIVNLLVKTHMNCPSGPLMQTLKAKHGIISALQYCITILSDTVLYGFYTLQIADLNRTFGIHLTESSTKEAIKGVLHVLYQQHTQENEELSMENDSEEEN